MTDIRFSSEMSVELISANASDRSVMAAARVSTRGSESLHDWTQEASEGLINFLMKNRHGTPFEHNQFIFFIEAPIFVFREFHRHRIGWSYNEISGRYSQLPAKFYLPGPDRPLMQEGKPGAYNYLMATNDQHLMICNQIELAARREYKRYEGLLEMGVAKEVARMVLPVNIYTAMYATCNARSLMAFLSLRQKHTKREPFIKDHVSAGPHEIDWTGEAMFPSSPMYEINRVADKMELAFREAMPITATAFRKNGYVGP